MGGTANKQLLQLIGPPGAWALFQYLLGHSGLECSVKQKGPFQRDIGISSVSQEAKKARTKDGNFTR